MASTSERCYEQDLKSLGKEDSLFQMTSNGPNGIQERSSTQSSASTAECSSSCPSPSSPFISHGYTYRRAISAPKYGTMVPNRIFVGGLMAGTSEMELMQLFSAYGNVKSTKVISDRAGVSKGYGFVTFETEEEARRMVQQESVVLRDRRLNIAPAIKKQPFNRVFGPAPVTPPASIRGGPVFLQNTMPIGFQNGIFCFVPQLPTPQAPVEADSNSMTPNGDPAGVYPNPMLSPSAAYPAVYPLNHPVYLPTQFQYPSLHQSSVGLVPDGALPLPYLAPVLDRLY